LLVLPSTWILVFSSTWSVAAVASSRFRVRLSFDTFATLPLMSKSFFDMRSRSPCAAGLLACFMFASCSPFVIAPAACSALLSCSCVQLPACSAAFRVSRPAACPASFVSCPVDLAVSSALATPARSSAAITASFRMDPSL
jgi:hypothetical protein